MSTNETKSKEQTAKATHVAKAEKLGITLQSDNVATQLTWLLRHLEKDDKLEITKQSDIDLLIKAVRTAKPLPSVEELKFEATKTQVAEKIWHGEDWTAELDWPTIKRILPIIESPMIKSITKGMDWTANLSLLMKEKILQTMVQVVEKTIQKANISLAPGGGVSIFKLIGTLQKENMGKAYFSELLADPEQLSALKSDMIWVFADDLVPVFPGVVRGLLSESGVDYKINRETIDDTTVKIALIPRSKVSNEEWKGLSNLEKIQIFESVAPPYSNSGSPLLLSNLHGDKGRLPGPVGLQLDRDYRERPNVVGKPGSITPLENEELELENPFEEEYPFEIIGPNGEKFRFVPGKRLFK